MEVKCKGMTCAALDGEACAKEDTAKIDASPAPGSRPGFFVDFTDYEDLLEEFNAAALKGDMKPSDSALDLIHLFATGELCLKGAK